MSSAPAPVFEHPDPHVGPNEHYTACGMGAAAPIGWVSYDFVHSLFYFLIVSLSVTPWVISDRGYPDIVIAVVTSLVAAGELALMPLLGALADRTGQRLLLFAVLIGIAGGLTIAVSAVGFHLGVWVLMTAFWLLLTALQLGYAQYEPLMAAVIESSQRARISGIGTGLGLIGVLVASALNAALPIAHHRQFVLLPAGIFLLVGVAVCVIAIRTRVPSGRHHGQSIRSDLHVHVRLRDLPATFRDLRENRPALRLLSAKFLYTDALITMNAYIVVYMDRMGVSKLLESLALVVGVLVGAIASFVTGRIVERYGPRLPVVTILPIFGVMLWVGAIFGQTWTIWAVGPVLGSTLGVVWTADRVWMLRLVPPEQRGEMFGFFNLANRASAALGPVVLWSATIALLYNGLGWLDKFDASRVAMALLGCSSIAGWLVVRGLSDTITAEDADTA